MIEKTLVDALDKASKKMNANNPTLGAMPTGFRDLDVILNGLNPGEILNIASRSGMGKTSFALSIISNHLLENSSEKIPFYYYSSDESTEALGMKLMSQLARVELKKIYSGKLHDKDWTRVAYAGDRVSKYGHIYLGNGTPFISVEAIEKIILGQEIKKHKIVIIDKLEALTLKEESSKDYRHQEIQDAILKLKQLGRDLNVSYIFLSDLDSKLEQRPNKRPMLRDLRDFTGGIESYSDFVLFIYRDEIYNRDTEDLGIGEIIIAKSKRTETDTVRLAFLSEYAGLWANLAKLKNINPKDKFKDYPIL